jgi:hypothetical protein
MSTRRIDLDVTRGAHGQWVIAALVHNHLETRRYYGYTKKEAIALFKNELAKVTS